MVTFDVGNKPVKILIGMILFLVVIIVSREVYVAVDKSRKIALGEKIIENLDHYSARNGLPRNDDYPTLQKLGFSDNADYFEPEYSRLGNDAYELIFIEGFDGPYLMWNSEERIWKIGQPDFGNRKSGR